MTLQIGIVLALLVAVSVVFAREWLPIDLATLALLIVLMLSGILEPREAFAGFANEVIVVLASLFVLSGAFVRTGVMEWLGLALHRLGATSESVAASSVMALAAAVSAFLSNTSATAILMPATFELSRRGRIGPSRLLMPLAFASMLGGTCTLIGTSTNLASSGMMAKLGLEPLGMFELAAVGVPISITGVLYLLLIGRRLLPHGDVQSLSGEYGLRRYLGELEVPESSALVGTMLGESRLPALGIVALEIRRGSQTIFPSGQSVFRAGDRLIVQAAGDALLEVTEGDELSLRGDVTLDDPDLVSAEIVLLEAMVMPSSSLDGATPRQARVRRRFGFSLLAIHRRGSAYPTGIDDMQIRVGDVLLLQGPRERFEALAGGAELWVLGEVAHVPFRRRRGLIAIGSLAVGIGLGAAGVLPLSVALLCAALTTVLAGCVDMRRVYELIEWRLIVLIGGMTSFGLAVEKTGTAEWLAELLAVLAIPFGITATLAALAALTMLLTQPLSNAAAALVVLPVAVATAHQLAVDPRPFAITVALAASLSFIAPFEPACLLVYGPGKYRFVDFIKVGAGLSVIVLAVLLLLVPRAWPL